jgi:CheY-specific phosphatase CheX
MQLEHTQSIINVFCRVMESLAFYFMDPVDSQLANMEDEIQTPYLCVSMRFEGPHGGLFDLYIPKGMMQTISANMLGVDESDATAISQQQDAVCELLNVICGQTITEIWGTNQIFDLRIPEIRSVDQQQIKPLLTQHNAHCFCGDDGIVLLVLTVDDIV